MFKLILALIVVQFTQSAFATEFDFDAESPTYDEKPLKNDPSTIQQKIENQMSMVCKDGLCTIVEKSTRSNGWSVTFNVGEGPSSYYGGGSGTVIVGDVNQLSQEYYGVTVRYENMKCTSQVNVPESVYQVLNTYVYSRLNEDLTTKKVLTDADRAALLEFVTLVNNAEGCRGQSSGGGGSRF